MEREQRKGYLMVFAAGCLWGTIGLFGTLLQNMGMNPSAVAFFRLLFASVLMIPVLLVKGKGLRLFRISRRGLLSCLLVGLFSQAIYNALYMTTLKHTGMAITAVLLYTSPVFVAVMSRLFFGEALRRNKILAIIINILGCILTVTGGQLAGLSLLSIGLLTGVGAGFMYATLPVLSRIGADREDPYTSTFYGLSFGALFLFFIVRPWQGIGAAFTPSMALTLLGFGIIPSALAYIIYFGGLGHIRETSKVPVLASVETVVASLIGLFVFSQPLGIVKVLGIALVLVSILIMNKKTPERL